MSNQTSYISFSDQSDLTRLNKITFGMSNIKINT